MQTTTANRRASDSRAGLMIYDTDVHHGFTSKQDLYPYLTQTYRSRLNDYGMGGGYDIYRNNGGRKGTRLDGVPEGNLLDGGGVAARSYELMRDQLLDGCGISRALLTGAPAYRAAVHTDLDYANALCRAFNEFTADHWLSKDDRLRMCISVCPQDPEGAAAEIRRIGSHPGAVAVILPYGTAAPYGQRFYHPIYEACVEHDLVVALHFTTEGSGVNPAPTAAGYPSYYVEGRLHRPHYYQVHIASLIFEAVFERFPTLKIAILEGGFSWVPTFVWKMDQEWKGLRVQTPWVKRWPSEYVLKHFRFASQPEDEPPVPEARNLLLDWMHAEQVLMYASDYPHWDWDDPAETLTGISDELMRARIFGGNASSFFRS